MSKSNIAHLKTIIKEFEELDSQKAEEAVDFLEAIEDELAKNEQKIRELEDEMSSFDDDDNNSELGGMEEHYVGLDTVYFRLQHGNLKIQMQMEAFMKSLAKQNCIPA